MRSYTATQGEHHLGALLTEAQWGPVQVLRRDRAVGVMVSARDYDAMPMFYANRLQATRVQNVAGAAAQGLTEGDVLRLLTHEG